MCDEDSAQPRIESLIAEATEVYKPLLVGSGTRLSGGDRLWRQYNQAVHSWRNHGIRVLNGVIERINELATARCLLRDPTLRTAQIWYEPEIPPDGTRFDFVVRDHSGATVYVEVKTVLPNTEDNDTGWQKYLDRQKKLKRNVNYNVAKEWQGARIFGDYFAARSSFLKYTIETEEKLARAQNANPGRGVLVFCGDGFHWHADELQDFLDFYRTGEHRYDDALADMEAHYLETRKISLRRNIADFAYVFRSERATQDKCALYKP